MSSVNMSHNCTSGYYCGAAFPFSLLAKLDREGRITEQPLSRDVYCILLKESLTYTTERPIQGVNPAIEDGALANTF